MLQFNQSYSNSNLDPKNLDSEKFVLPTMSIYVGQVTPCHIPPSLVFVNSGALHHHYLLLVSPHCLSSTRSSPHLTSLCLL